MIRAKLTDRHGALVGYCDVPIAANAEENTPAIPEVISLSNTGAHPTAADGRTFVRDPRHHPYAMQHLPAGTLPVYIEQVFAWGENFRPASESRPVEEQTLDPNAHDKNLCKFGGVS